MDSWRRAQDGVALLAEASVCACGPMRAGRRKSAAAKPKRRFPLAGAAGRTDDLFIFIALRADHRLGELALAPEPAHDGVLDVWPARRADRVHGSAVFHRSR